MHNKSFLSRTMFILVNISLCTALLADIPLKKDQDTEQVLQPKQKEDIQISLVDAQEGTSTVLDKTIIFFAKGAFWYVVIGGTVFIIAAGSLALNMLWQFANRNP